MLVNDSAESVNAPEQQSAMAVVEEPRSEGCPPPLAWQEVLRDFSTQAEAWYLDRPRYRLTGRMFGNGPPLYLLNGIGGSLELYALLVWLLKDQYRCVLFDYPGNRPSESAARNVTLDELSDDLLAVAEKCGDDSFDLYATSFGGLVAMQTLLREPQRVRKLILQGAFARRELALSERMLVRALRHSPGRLRHVPGRARIQFHNHRRWFPPFDTTRFQFFLENAGHVPVATIAQRAAIIRDSDFRDNLPRVSQPVLLIRSEGEGLVSEACHIELERGLPKARTEWMHGTGHLTYLTHPHRLAKLIREFL